MTIAISGSSGHLGEALMRMARADGRAAIGIDIKPGRFTTHVGSIGDRCFLENTLAGVRAVIHAATLHKPHVATHAPSAFVEVNVAGTLNLLEAARAAGAQAFVFTSTTSVYSDAVLRGSAEEAVWIDESVTPHPKNIYGATKLGAEHLVRLYADKFELPAVILRTSRFFPEEDDSPEVQAAYPQENARVNELLYRRVDIEDAARAHFLALDCAEARSGRCYIISAQTPFARADAPMLARDPARVVASKHDFEDAYAVSGWRMFDRIDRVYDSALACAELGWRPVWDFAAALEAVKAGRQVGSDLMRAVGSKGYHDRPSRDGSFPV